MDREQVIGMFVGAFLGDMLGAPYEFGHAMSPEDVKLTTGGSHGVTLGEYTDDGALTLALAESYVARGKFDAQDAAKRFIDWRRNGTYGTRVGSIVDIGRTTENAIGRMSAERPYAATGGTHDSGNGSIMRIAACIAANHRRPMEAVADAVAASLMTHGNSDILKYTALFIQEILSAPGPFNTSLYLNPSSFRDGKGSIMYAFNAARYAIHYGKGDGGEVLRRAVAYGWDTDTNACVAGMWVGAREGIDCFPKEYIDALQNKDRIFEVANKLFEIGASK